MTVETSKGTAGYVDQTAQAVKEKAGQAAGYAGEKAVDAKEVIVETSKSTAGYVGQVAETEGQNDVGRMGSCGVHGR